MTMRGYYVKAIGSNRGAPRIWLEGKQVESAGLAAGSRFDIKIAGGSVVLQAKPDGSRVVSSKKKGDRDLPIIDINSKELLAIFDGMSSIRLMQREGQIYLMPLASELKKKERLGRLKKALLSGDPITMGSISHGGGVMTHAIHSGLQDAGVTSKLSFANEIRSELIEQASHANSAWDKDTIALGAPVQELAFDHKASELIPKIHILEAGLPCSGASSSGKAKRGLVHAEAHPEVGHLVVAALVILSKVNPAIFVLENVVPYSASASADILRNQLRDMGYVTHETVLNGSDFNDIEERKRWCLVAVTEGMAFDWDMLQKPEKKTVVLSDLLDDIPSDSPLWSEMKGLKAKQERDVAAGKGFKMQIVDADATRVPTMTKGYAKVRSTDGKVRHPENPDLLRQFTPGENAKFKQIPVDLIKGLSNTIAHELLGQSVSHSSFTAVGRLLGDTLKTFAAEMGIDMSKPKAIAQVAAAIADEITDSADKVVSEIRRPAKGATYEGVVTVSDLGMIIQDVGNGVGILHDATKLAQDHNVSLGSILEIHYPKSGAAVVIDQGAMDEQHDPLGASSSKGMSLSH